MRTELQKYIENGKSHPSAKIIQCRLEEILTFLNVRFGLKVRLRNNRLSGASACYQIKTIDFDFDGKYSGSIKMAIAVFAHEYAHILLRTLKLEGWEENCDQFSEILIKELEVSNPKIFEV